MAVGVADGKKDGRCVIVGVIEIAVGGGVGVMNSLDVIDELLHEDKINRDRQNTLVLKRIFIDFIILKWLYVEKTQRG